MNSPPNDQTTNPLTLAERKALNWYKNNGPASPDDPGVPDRKVRIALMQRGLLGFSPKRKQFDPIIHDITDRGREWLKT